MKAGKDYFVTVLFSGYGHWKVEVHYLRSGKKKTAITSNTELIQRFKDVAPMRERGYAAICAKLKSLVN